MTQTEKNNNPVFADDPGCTPSVSSSWHGAQVTGMINAMVDNDGIAGIAPGSFVIMSRALGKCGGYISDIMDASLYSAGLPVPSADLDGMGSSRADIINLSLGGGGDCTPTEGEAIWEIVTQRNVVVVTAAGNEGGDANASAPGNCTGTINVAANTRLGGETAYTNIGSFVDISAPGGNESDPDCDADPECFSDITTTSFNISTLPDDTWRDRGPFPDESTLNLEARGTSFSAPIVTGIIALMLDANELLRPVEVYSILTETAQPFPTNAIDAPRDCTTDRCGAGIIDAEAAVNAASSASFSTRPFPIKSNTPDGSGGGEGNSEPFFGATGKGGGGGSIAPLVPLALMLLMSWRRIRH